MMKIPKIVFSISVICSLILIFYFSPSGAKLFGRPVWHDPKKIIDYELDGKGTSMQIFDIYTFSHITHGILLYFILKYIGYEDTKIIYLAPIIEILWEWIENTPYIINKYRSKTEFQNYRGDSIVNILGDVIAEEIGMHLTCTSPTLGIMYIVISELILNLFNASFIHLSIGSLI